MKKQLLKVPGLLIIILFLFSSCEMAQTKSGWNWLADGAKVPSELAIASGDAKIMLECLEGLNSQFDAGGMSNLERGEIALDMIDLLAVLSNVIVNIAPYLLGQADPATLVNLTDFFDSADLAILEQIAHQQLMEAGIHADPAPMQLLWSIISLASYENFDNSTMTATQLAFYNSMVVEANALAAEGSNTSFQPLLDKFLLELGW